MMTKTRNKGLLTDKDKQGLAEKKGLDMGSLLSEEDRRKGLGLKDECLFTKKDKEGLM
jgi:hypothetical protein